MVVAVSLIITLVALKSEPDGKFAKAIASGDSITMSPRVQLAVARIAAVAVIVSAAAMKFLFIKIRV